MSDGGGATAERLRELQRLLDDGLISEAEHEERRARILDEAFGPGETEIASDSGEDRPVGPDADAPRDEGAPPSSAPEVEAKPDPPGERVVNPARWPNWLRITAIVVSGVWIVSIPFMFWRAARFTWLPYLGVATVAILALGVVVGDTGDDADQSAPAPAAQSVDSATPVPMRTPRPAATTAPTPEAPVQSTEGPSVVITSDDGAEIRLETRRQAEIVTYYLAVFRHLGPSDHNLDAWRHATTLYESGQVSDGDYYQYTRSAYDAHHYLAREWMSKGPRAPAGLHELSAYVSGVLQKRGDAMGHAALVIGTGDTEEAAKGIELLKQATAGVVFVLGKLMFAANESGINTEALQHVVHCDEESRVCGLRPPTSGVPLLLSDCPHGVTETELSVCRDGSSRD